MDYMRNGNWQRKKNNCIKETEMLLMIKIMMIKEMIAGDNLTR